MSRKIIRTQTVSGKKERDEIAQMSARAKKDVYEAKLSVEKYSKQLKAIIKKVSDTNDTYKKAEQQAKTISEEVKVERAYQETIQQNIKKAQTQDKDLTSIIHDKKNEVAVLNRDLQEYNIRLSNVQSKFSKLLDEEIRVENKIEDTKKEIQVVKDQSGEVHKQTLSLVEQSKRLEENIESLKEDISTRKSSLDIYMSESDIKITTAQQELDRITIEIGTANTELKKVNINILKELEAVRSEKKGLEIYRGHNIRLLNELNIKVKEAKAYRENQIIGEYLTKNGL